MQIKSNCILCKGRDPQRYCGRISCPIIMKANSMFSIDKQMPAKDFFGESPAPFVGRYGYPNINVGILSPPEAENTWEYDAPRHWAASNYDIQNIIDFRSALINSRFKANIKQADRMIEISREVGMASKPVEMEINLKDKPRFRVQNDSYLAPTGPNASLIKADITSNPKIDTRVDKIVSDTDLRSAPGMSYLFRKGFDENFISRILSVGNLGVKKYRKLVPTRWSITATDDTIGKDIIEEISRYNQADYLAYFGSYLGNYYLILMFPDAWSYELFETYMPNASWNPTHELQYTTDYEGYYGRKDYAFNCAGGYYAARLPILQKLKEMKRQASVLAIRVITGEYIAPLGVWVVREATRKAAESRPIEFGSKELMLKYASSLLKKKFGMDAEILFKKSRLLDSQKQVKITHFLG